MRLETLIVRRGQVDIGLDLAGQLAFHGAAEIAEPGVIIVQLGQDDGGALTVLLGHAPAVDMPGFERVHLRAHRRFRACHVQLARAKVLVGNDVVDPGDRQQVAIAAGIVTTDDQGLLLMVFAKECGAINGVDHAAQRVGAPKRVRHRGLSRPEDRRKIRPDRVRTIGPACKQG